MKQITLILAIMLYGMTAFSQQLFFEAYSGYNLTNYGGTTFDETEGYVPIGFKLAGGHEHVQIGFDYRQHITNPTFETGAAGIDLATFDFEETFYGAFLRGNISSLPAYRFGLIGSVGAGFYTPTFNSFLGEGTDNQISSVEYDRKLGYNFYLGVSAPIFAQLHWELGYQYNIVDQVLDGEVINSGNYHSIHIGLSANLVFGNTEKRCRRVIKKGRGNY